MRRTGLALLTLPITAEAHSFGKLYNLPVPLWLYLYGAVAALVLSFVAMAWLGRVATQRAGLGSEQAPDGNRAAPGWLEALLRMAQVGSLSLLALAIISGFAGSQNAYANFNMSGFWIGFVLAFAYLVALVGPIYEKLNPWWLIVRGIERLSGEWQGRIAAPQRFGVLPALWLYMAFIWLELFGGTTPFSLSVVLSAYTLINIAGSWLLGTRAWFVQGEFFAVFLRLLALCAPLHWLERGVQWRWPFAGLLRERTPHWSGVVFILFMLSSTAFDGLRDTVPWVKLFWKDLNTLLWLPLFGDDVVETYALLKWIYLGWQTTALLVSPFVYVAAYLACLKLSLALTHSRHSLRTLALRFAPTLIPIALVYHVTHYYTLLFTQGAQLPWLLSDPFGTGSEWAWRWLGEPRAFIPDAGTVWHTQVGLIVLGHVVSVVLAHQVALQMFATRRLATRSQLPMLLLMMLYTASGLWILAQPLNPGG